MLPRRQTRYRVAQLTRATGFSSELRDLAAIITEMVRAEIVIAEIVIVETVTAEIGSLSLK